MAALTIHDNWFTAIAALSDVERGKLFLALMEYRAGKEPEELGGVAGNLFSYMRGDIDRARRNAANGAKGGAPKGNRNAAKQPKVNPDSTQIQPKNNPDSTENQASEQEVSPLSSPLSLSPTPPISLPPIIPPQETLLSPPSGGDEVKETSKATKRTPPPLDHTSDAYKAARYLDRRIRERLPTKPAATEATLQAWALEIDRLHRLDGQSWDDIADALEFSQDDDFWAPNIMSGAKFRKQFFRLLAQMQRAKGGRR